MADWLQRWQQPDEADNDGPPAGGELGAWLFSRGHVPEPAAKKEAAVKKAAEKEAAVKKAAEKEAAVKKAAEKEGAVKKAAEKEAAVKKAAEKEAAVKKAAEKQVVNSAAETEAAAAAKLDAEKEAAANPAASSAWCAGAMFAPYPCLRLRVAVFCLTHSILCGVPGFSRTESLCCLTR